MKLRTLHKPSKPNLNISHHHSIQTAPSSLIITHNLHRLFRLDCTIETNFLFFASYKMSPPPPPFRQCLRSAPWSKFRIRSSQYTPSRAFANGPKPPRPDEPPRGVWAPKTRIAVGIVFIGAMIYSMVACPTPQNTTSPLTPSGNGKANEAR
jgi:hypothetical protein